MSAGIEPVAKSGTIVHRARGHRRAAPGFRRSASQRGHLRGDFQVVGEPPTSREQDSSAVSAVGCPGVGRNPDIPEVRWLRERTTKNCAPGRGPRARKARDFSVYSPANSAMGRQD